MTTFIIDCPRCKARVGAEQGVHVDSSYFDDDAGEPYGHRISVGKCPHCKIILVGRSEQLQFEGYQGSEYDTFGDIVRVHPNPPKAFTSYRIPRTLRQSLLEADLSLQVGANIAACMMLGRALEALCRDILEPKSNKPEALAEGAPNRKKYLMLGEGIRRLHEQKIIDERLYEWSQSLHAIRNLVAHPEDITVSREDAEDLQVFVNAITEYVYDLSDRHEEFKSRQAEKKKPRKSAMDMFGGILPAQPERP
jgi:hypothetical protein